MECLEVINVLQQDTSLEGFNLGINIDKATGAGFSWNTHIHIVHR